MQSLQFIFFWRYLFHAFLILFFRILFQESVENSYDTFYSFYFTVLSFSFHQHYPFFIPFCNILFCVFVCRLFHSALLLFLCVYFSHLVSLHRELRYSIFNALSFFARTIFWHKSRSMRSGIVGWCQWVKGREGKFASGMEGGYQTRQLLFNYW